jgi:hypothetical protein
LRENWSIKGNYNKGNVLTPNMRLKGLIGIKIKTYNLDEYCDKEYFII